MQHKNSNFNSTTTCSHFAIKTLHQMKTKTQLRIVILAGHVNLFIKLHCITLRFLFTKQHVCVQPAIIGYTQPSIMFNYPLGGAVGQNSDVPSSLPLSHTHRIKKCSFTCAFSHTKRPAKMKYILMNAHSPVPRGPPPAWR